MQVILLERVEKLGTIGDEVSVKSGFARNFLIPQGKALRANAANRARFERERAAIEKRNEEAKTAAGDSGKSLEGKTFTLIRSAGDSGQLYGSVSARDICAAAADHGDKISRSQVRLNKPIKAIGMHEVEIRLHPEVSVNVTANVARSPDEAERQAAGENIIETLASEQAEAESEQADALAEAAAERAAEGPADADE